MAKENKKKIICFVAGKSGGHLLPAVTLAEDYLQEYPDATILFFCTSSLLDKQLLLHKKKFRILFLPLAQVPRSKLLLPVFFIQCVLSFLYALIMLLWYRPAYIMSTGGLIGIPVGIAGFLMRIPLDLFELNVIPGKAIKFLAPFARTIFICFEKSKTLLPAHKCVVHPYPLRKTLLHHGVTPPKSKKKLFILGGSQGSAFLNTLIAQWLVTITDDMKKDFSVIHQIGDVQSIQWQHFYQQHGLEAYVFSFNDDIGSLYQQADLIVCRSGAGTLFEVSHFQKPCITIPLKTATTDHQLYNAQEMAKKYSFIHCMKQEEVVSNKKIFFDLVNKYLSQSV